MYFSVIQCGNILRAINFRYPKTWRGRELFNWNSIRVNTHFCSVTQLTLSALSNWLALLSNVLHVRPLPVCNAAVSKEVTVSI